jgi:hypothetical protein
MGDEFVASLKHDKSANCDGAKYIEIKVELTLLSITLFD